MKVTVFSEGKNPPKNEDSFGYNDTCFVVCDGSTGKRGEPYNGETGGKIASSLMTGAALESKLNGEALVEHLTLVLEKKRLALQKMGHEIELETTLACARIVGNLLYVTQVGDTAFRINGSETHENHAVIDTLMSRTRAQYIELTHDIEGGRDYIMPLLLNEEPYRNNPNNPAGYGVIDGNQVPSQFIKSYTFNLADVRTLEIYTDGYFAIPETANIKDYEELNIRVQKEDPYKCLVYPSTKSADDRTVMIIVFT